MIIKREAINDSSTMYKREAMTGAVHQPRQHQQHSQYAAGDDDDDFDNDNTVEESTDSPSSHHAFPHALYSNGEGIPVPHNPSSINQLTLAFQGHEYVFDPVSPEKVNAVILLLEGYDVPTGIPTRNMAPHGQRVSSEGPGRLNQSHRAASLSRYREKRKERCFEKKLRYTVRKEVALRMQRKKGQFTSSKSVSDETGSSSAEGNACSSQEEQETSCRHCGISSKCTPMMRRGPDGPKSLCNACGLTWANKGILRDFVRVPATTVQNHTVKTSEQVKGEGDGYDAMAAGGIITSYDENMMLESEQ